MLRRFWVAVSMVMLLAFAAAPAFAQGPTEDRVCTGGTTTVASGETVRSLVLLGCSGNVQSGGTVQLDAVVFGGSLNIDKGAKIQRSVAIVGGSVNIGGEIGNNVSVAGGSANLLDSAVVNGDVSIAGGSLNRASGATVRGSVSQGNGPRVTPPIPPVAPSFPSRFFNFGSGLARDVLNTLAMVVLGVLAAVFFPAPIRRVAATAQAAAVPSVGVGCLTLILVPILTILLAITIIGIPVAILLVLVAVIAGYVGWLCIGYLLGERILHALNARQITPVFAIITGIVLLAILHAMPFVGWIVSIVVTLIGLGAIVLTRFGTQTYPLGPTAGSPVGPLPLAPLPPQSPYPAPAPSINDVPPASPRAASEVVPATPVAASETRPAAAPVTPPSEVVPAAVAPSETPSEPTALRAEPFALAPLPTIEPNTPATEQPSGVPPVEDDTKN